MKRILGPVYNGVLAFLYQKLVAWGLKLAVSKVKYLLIWYYYYYDYNSGYKIVQVG